MTYFDEKLSSKKIFLFISMAAVLFADLFVTVLLIGFGVGFSMMIAPLILVAVDIIFLVLAVFTNFRFAYSIKYVAIYSVAAAALTVLFALLGSGIGNDGVVMTILSALLWAAVHLFFAFAFSASVATASSDGGKGKASAAILSALSVAAVAAYGAFVIGSGVFGQGFAEMSRTLVYEYDEDNDCYIASGVLSGRGDKVKIPESFNGKPVGAIDLSLIASEELSLIDLSERGEIKLVNADSVKYEGGAEIRISKDSFESFAKEILLSGECGSDGAAIKLYEKLMPTGFASDEIYVTFSYDEKTLSMVGGELMPIWVGKKNDIFTLSYAQGVSYVKKSDRDDEALLSELYNSDAFGGGYILTDLKAAGGDNLVGKKLTASEHGVRVAFEKIYNIYFAFDNDDLFELDESYVKRQSGGRYVVLSGAEDLIRSAPAREGFTLDWEYPDFSVKSIEEAIKASSEPKINISARWTMIPPEIISLTADKDGGAYIYGDSMRIDSEVKAAAESFGIRYRWENADGDYASADEDLSVALMNYDGGGKYKLRAVSYYDGNSSLTASAEASIDITVDKKLLPLTFNPISNNGFTKVYDAEESLIEISIDESAIVADDEIKYALSVESVTKAGEYTAAVTLLGDSAEKYKTSVDKCVYTVYPRPLTVAWSDTNEFVYNGEGQIREASITSGVVGSDDVYLLYSGEGVSAGEYTAKISSDNPNYKVEERDSEASFTVKPAPLSVTWDPETLELIYNGSSRKPAVEAVLGEIGSEKALIAVRVDGSAKNVGTYTAEAYLTTLAVNKNYYIETGKETQFEISAKPITVSWENTSMVYNGNGGRLPTPKFDGVVGADDVMKTVSSNESAKNVGEYTATVTVANPNYKISGGGSCLFTISKASLNLRWGSTALVYSGAPQAPTAEIASGLQGSDSFTVTVNGKETAASQSERTASVSLTPIGDSLVANYEITNPSIAYVISPKELTLTWSGLSVTYNAMEQKPTVTYSGAVTGEDPLITVTGGKDADVYTAVVTVGNSNYKLRAGESGVRAFEIKKAPLTVTWTGKEFTYDGTEHTPTATVSSGALLSDSVSVKVSGGGAKAAGAYTASAESVNNNYYVLNGATYGYSVTPAKLEVSWSGLNVTYNGEEQKPAVSIISGLISGDDANITVPSKKQAGSYELTLSIGNKNYELKESSMASATFTVERAPIIISWENKTLTYNGYAQAPTPRSETPLFGSDTVSFIVDGEKTDVGTYTASAVSSSINYTVVGGRSTDYTIVPKEISLRFTETTFVYDKTSHTPKYDVIGVVYGDAGVQVTGQGMNAGEYDITYSLTNANYILSDASKKVRMTVLPKAITVTLLSDKLVYSGEEQTPTPITDGVIAGDDAAVTLLGSGTDVGTYQVTVSVGNGNYELSSPATLSFEITKKKVEVSWLGGTEFVYDGSEKAPDCTCLDAGGNEFSATVKYYVLGENGWEAIGGAPKEIGRYKAEYVPSDSGNYEFTNTVIEYAVKEAS